MTITIDQLRHAAESGAVHTVRISFSDRLGNWRGKRVPVRQFLASYTGDGATNMGFCDGMLVADVSCDVIQETPFSNYDTGYPDAHLWFTGRAIRPVGWSDGEVFVFGRTLDAHHQPEAVHPPNVLEAVLNGMNDRSPGATMSARLSGRLMASSSRPVPIDQWPDGSTWGVLGRAAEALTRSGVPVAALSGGRDCGFFTIDIAASQPSQLAEDLVVTKNSLKEMVTDVGLTASFMTRPPGSSQCSTLELIFDAQGLDVPDSVTLANRLDQARPLLQPSPNAYKLGPAPRDGTSIDSDGRCRVTASAEADPFTAAAVALAAAHAAGTDSATASWTAAGSISGDARAMVDARWLRDWLGATFVDNSAPLLAREGDLLDAAVTDFEVDRYWAFA